MFQIVLLWLVNLRGGWKLIMMFSFYCFSSFSFFRFILFYLSFWMCCFTLLLFLCTKYFVKNLWIVTVTKRRPTASVHTAWSPPSLTHRFRLQRPVQQILLLHKSTSTTDTLSILYCTMSTFTSYNSNTFYIFLQ